MKVGLKDMKKAYKNVKIDKIEVRGSQIKHFSWEVWIVCWLFIIPSTAKAYLQAE